MAIRVIGGVLMLPQQGGVNVTGTHHNVDPGAGAVMYARGLAIGGAITGLAGAEADRLLIVQPTRNSPEEIVFSHNTGSSAGQRIQTASGTVAVTAFWGSCGMFLYDAVDAVWKEVG